MAAGVAPRAPIGHRRLLRIFSGGGRSRRGRRRGCKVGARGLRQLPARRGASFRVVDILIIFIPPTPPTHTYTFFSIYPPTSGARRAGWPRNRTRIAAAWERSAAFAFSALVFPFLAFLFGFRKGFRCAALPGSRGSLTAPSDPHPPPPAVTLGGRRKWAVTERCASAFRSK